MEKFRYNFFLRFCALLPQLPYGSIMRVKGLRRNLVVPLFGAQNLHGTVPISWAKRWRMSCPHEMKWSMGISTEKPDSSLNGLGHLSVDESLVDVSSGKTIGRVGVHKFQIDIAGNPEVFKSSTIGKIDLQGLPLILKVGYF